MNEIESDWVAFEQKMVAHTRDMGRNKIYGSLRFRLHT